MKKFKIKIYTKELKISDISIGDLVYNIETKKSIVVDKIDYNIENGINSGIKYLHGIIVTERGVIKASWIFDNKIKKVDINFES